MRDLVWMGTWGDGLSWPGFSGDEDLRLAVRCGSRGVGDLVVVEKLRVDWRY